MATPKQIKKRAGGLYLRFGANDRGTRWKNLGESVVHAMWKGVVRSNAELIEYRQSKGILRKKVVDLPVIEPFKEQVIQSIYENNRQPQDQPPQGGESPNPEWPNCYDFPYGYPPK